MFNIRSLNAATLLVTTCMLAACGPGGGNSSDVFPRETQPTTAITGPNSFLLFPNPQKQADSTLQTNTTAYATAYYAVVELSTDKRDTLAKFKTANGFGNSATGTEVSVVFGDVKDLGYGRRMTARKNNDGTLAFWVENYLVSAAANYTYSSLNLDAAVVRDTRWHVGTNAIEFTPPPGVGVTANCGNCYPKFFTYNPTTGERLLEAQLDGRGKKAMPGICITCHGGRGDPLKADGTFPRSVTDFPGTSDTTALAGDVQAHLQSFDVGSFGFSSTSGYTRADQEARLKTMNQWVLCSYPLPNGTATPTGNAEDVCRPVAPTTNVWQGSAAEMVKDWYGGPGMPNATNVDTYLPLTAGAASGSGWAAATGQDAFYKNVIAKSCRVCHILRGNGNMDEINFRNYCTDVGAGSCDLTKTSYFKGYANRVKAHVVDRGNMPLSKLIYERYLDSTQPDAMANLLALIQSEAVRDSNGAVLKAGRPVAIPGPDRTTDSPATLSAANSLFATTYAWSIVSGAGGTLTNANSVQATLIGVSGTTYVLQLIVSDGTTQSAAVTVNVTIATPAASTVLPKSASSIRFSDIKTFIQGSSPGCGPSCHYAGNAATTWAPPIFYTDYDRNGSGTYSVGTGLANDLTNDDWWFYNDLRGRINFTDIEASPILRKPRGTQHGAGYLVLDFTSAGACAAPCSGYGGATPLGDYYKAYYNMIVLWILNGAPY